MEVVLLSEKLQKKYCGKICVNKHGSKMEIISYTKQIEQDRQNDDMKKYEPIRIIDVFLS